MENQENHRRNTGADKKFRIEGWFTTTQKSWLRTLAVKEDRSISSVLRQAVNLYVKKAIEEQKALEKAYKEQG